MIVVNPPYNLLDIAGYQQNKNRKSINEKTLMRLFYFLFRIINPYNLEYTVNKTAKIIKRIFLSHKILFVINCKLMVIILNGVSHMGSNEELPLRKIEKFFDDRNNY